MISSFDIVFIFLIALLVIFFLCFFKALLASKFSLFEILLFVSLTSFDIFISCSLLTQYLNNYVTNKYIYK